MNLVLFAFGGVWRRNTQASRSAGEIVESIRRIVHSGLVFVFFLACITSPVAWQSQQPETVIVSQAVQEAVEKNLNLMAERYNLNIADARVITARLRPNPVLSVGGDHLELAGFWLLAEPASREQTRGPDPRQQGQPGQIETIRVETSLVTVPVILTDRAGRFVTGLARSDFQLFEDGKPQEVTSFSSTETPFNVALLIDTSRSTREVLGEIRKAARNFVNQLQPQDRVLIVAFDEKVNFLGDFTSDRRELRRTINSVKSSYLTTVYDAISRTISEKFAPLKGRKAIVVFSDGVDTWSQATYESTLDLAARSGALIYAVQYNTSNIGGPATSPYLLPRRYFAAPSVPGQQNRMRAEFERHRIATNFLRALAEQSGARHLQAASIENSERAFALIADELRNQYLLEYYSTNDQRDGGYRTITVRLKRDDLVVRARKGYRAPKAESRSMENQEMKPSGRPKP